MRIHSGLLALALLLLVVLACTGGKNGNNSGGNTNNMNNMNHSSDSGSSTSKVRIDELYMAKDEGGKYGAKTTSYSPSEHKVWAIAKLSESEAGTNIKFIWYLGDRKLKELDYTTKPLEDTVSGHLELPSDWPTGDYKVEAYVNGNLNKTVEYTVE
jgi:hypothetical protein